MSQLRNTLCLGLLSVTLGLAAQLARAADQTVPGAGNATAIALSSKSPMVQSAKEFLLERIKKIDNATTSSTRENPSGDCPPAGVPCINASKQTCFFFMALQYSSENSRPA